MDRKTVIKEYGILFVGTFFVAIAVYFFMLPSNVVVGSLSGLVMVLTNFIPIKVSILSYILNGVLLLIGFLLIGREFGAKTIICSLLLPTYIFIFEIIFPNQPSLTNDILLDTICYVMVVSVGLAMLFNINASSGGLDIVAKLLNKFLHMELGKAMTFAGMFTAVCSILVYDTKTLVLSVLGTYANGIVVDYFIEGFNRKKRICILSTEYEQIRKFIVEELKEGVTVYKAYGGYNKEEKVELITIVDRMSYGRLLEYLHSVDSKVFVTVSTVNEVIGHWNIERKLGK